MMQVARSCSMSPRPLHEYKITFEFEDDAAEVVDLPSEMWFLKPLDKSKVAEVERNWRRSGIRV